MFVGNDAFGPLVDDSPASFHMSPYVFAMSGSMDESAATKPLPEPSEPVVRETDLAVRAASALLPHVDKDTTKVRWRGRLHVRQFVDRLDNFLVSIMSGSAATYFTCDDDVRVLRELAAAQAAQLERRGRPIVPRALSEVKPKKGAAPACATGARSKRESAVTHPGWADPNFVMPHCDVTLRYLFQCAVAHVAPPGDVHAVLGPAFGMADGPAVNDDATLTYEEFMTYLVDSAIRCSSSLGTTDSLFYVEAKRTRFSVPCNYATAVGGDNVLVVQQANQQAPPDAVLAHHRTAAAISRSSWPATASVVAHVPSRRVFACCAELSVFFIDANTGKDLVGKLLLDTLGGAPCTLMWSDRHATLFGASRDGVLWHIDPPTWSPKTATWIAPSVQRSQRLVTDMPIAQIAEGSAANLLFILTARGSLLVFNTQTNTILSTNSCADNGMLLCSCVVYNAAADYVICSGEASHLLAWVGRNAPGQSPMRVDDRATPHLGRVTGLVSDPHSAMVASMDGQGVCKIWDLATMHCTQTIRVTIAELDAFVSLIAYNKELLVVLRHGMTLYKVDDEEEFTPVRALTGTPKGVSVLGCVGRDIVEWSCANGRKVQHVQEAADATITSVCFADEGRVLVVLTDAGQLSSHIASTGKRMTTYSRKLAKSEPLLVQYCAATKRLVVPTVDDEVYFVELDGRSEPTVCKLIEGDSTCSCLAIGKVDSGSNAFFVGTSENTLQVLVSLSPTVVTVSKRLEMPNAAEGHHMTAVTWSEGNVVCADSGGNLHVFLTRNLRYVSTFQLEDVPVYRCIEHPPHLRNVQLPQAYADQLDAEALETGGLTTHVSRYVTCCVNIVVGVFFVVGDSAGHVTVFRIERKRGLEVLATWRAHCDAVTSIAVENDTVFTASMSPSMSVWSLDGACCGHWWGPAQRVEHVRVPPAPWLAAFDERESASTVYNTEAIDAAAADQHEHAQFGAALLEMTRKKLLRHAQQNVGRRIVETTQVTTAERALVGGVTTEEAIALPTNDQPTAESIAALVIENAEKAALADTPLEEPLTTEETMRPISFGNSSNSAPSRDTPADSISASRSRLQRLRATSPTASGSRGTSARPSQQQSRAHSHATLPSSVTPQPTAVLWRRSDRDPDADVRPEDKPRVTAIANDTFGLPVLRQSRAPTTTSGAPHGATPYGTAGSHDPNKHSMSESSLFKPMSFSSSTVFGKSSATMPVVPESALHSAMALGMARTIAAASSSAIKSSAPRRGLGPPKPRMLTKLGALHNLPHAAPGAS